MAGDAEGQGQMSDEVPDDQDRDYGGGDGEVGDHGVGGVQGEVGAVPSHGDAEVGGPSRLLILSHLRQEPATVTMGMVTVTRNGRASTYALFDQHVAALLDEAVFHAEHVRLGTPDTSRAHTAT